MKNALLRKKIKKSIEPLIWHFGCIFCIAEFDNPDDLDIHIKQEHRKEMILF